MKEFKDGFICGASTFIAYAVALTVNAPVGLTLLA